MTAMTAIWGERGENEDARGNTHTSISPAAPRLLTSSGGSPPYTESPPLHSCPLPPSLHQSVTKRPLRHLVEISLPPPLAPPPSTHRHDQYVVAKFEAGRVQTRVLREAAHQLLSHRVNVLAERLVELPLGRQGCGQGCGQGGVIEEPARSPSRARSWCMRGGVRCTVLWRRGKRGGVNVIGYRNRPIESSRNI